ncbi:MAG: type IV pilus modification PilV family protein [Caldicoprobacterales bacterium]|jgi:prepilin-type N-terminal cleavage/methylation domain-containing protein
MKKSIKDRGSTLLECVIALAVLCILATSFLGIQTNFAKLNQISSLNLKTSTYASNLYETIKGMSLPKLSDISTTGAIWNDHIKYVIEAERYPYTNHELIDLVIQSDSMSHYIIYALGDSLQGLHSVTGQGNLIISLRPDESYTSIHLSNESGETAKIQFRTKKDTQIISIHGYSIHNTQQQILIKMNELPSTNWLVYLYEHPYQRGKVTIHLNDRTINTKEILAPLHEDTVSVYPRKTETDIKIPISLQITAFKEGKEAQPICRRQGIIWIKPF